MSTRPDGAVAAILRLAGPGGMNGIVTALAGAPVVRLPAGMEGVIRSAGRLAELDRMLARSPAARWGWRP